MKQLTLGLILQDNATFDNFLVGDNQQLYQTLQDFVQAKTEAFIYLWGELGVGRSHLLQACARAVHTNAVPVAYLNLADTAELNPAVLQGLEHMQCVCLDDIDSVMQQDEWEEALFHFYNRCKEHHTRLLVSANCPPVQLTCRLADLKSRLSWGLTFQVNALTDHEKMQALQIRAQNRGMVMSVEVAKFLMAHYPRNMRDLFAALEQLEHASLAQQRRLTIPFVKATLC